MERQRQPQRSDEADELLAAAGVALCPYCKGALVEGTLAGACEGCNTLHHVGCFAEHRGCSTRGCASTHARSLRVGSPPPVDFPARSCAVCKTALAPDAMLAECACGRTLDVNCFETIGACGAPGCRRPVRLLGHAEAVALRARRAGLQLGLTGLVALLAAGGLGGAAWYLGAKAPLAGLIGGAVLLTALAVLLLSLAWGQRRRRKTLEQLPAPRPPGEGRTKPAS